MPGFEIRRMKGEDIDRTVAVWERSRWDAQPWLEERMSHSHEDNLRYFKDVLSNQYEVWLACTDDGVVGLLAIHAEKIDQLHVEPCHQGQGVGSALLDHAKELAPRGLTLFTHQRNTRARAFYERRGFRPAAFGISPPPEIEPDVRYEWRPSEGPDPIA